MADLQEPLDPATYARAYARWSANRPCALAGCGCKGLRLRFRMPSSPCRCGHAQNVHPQLDVNLKFYDELPEEDA